MSVAPSVQRRKVWLTPTSRVLRSNAVKTRNPLKFAVVPKTRQQISAVSRRKFTIIAEHVEKLLLFNKFFPIVDTCLSSEDIPDKIVRWCADGDFFAFCISSEPRAADFRHAL